MGRPREGGFVEDAGNADERRMQAAREPPVGGSDAGSLARGEYSSRRQEALIQAGLALASELSLPAVLQKITDLACEVADARYGALGVLGQDGRLRDFITCGVTEEERGAIGDLPVGHGILGVLITEAYPLRLQRIQDDSRSVGFPANHPPMTSFLGVPVSVRGRVYGNLYLTEKRDVPEFTADDERAVVTLAAQAGVAIENARLFGEAQERLAMEARHRLARELHDSVSQALFSMTLETRAAQLALQHQGTDPSGDLGSRLARLQQLTENALAEMRALIFELRPEALREEGLAAAIRQHALAVAARADLIIEVETVEDRFPLPPDIEEEMYRTAQEALTNVIKHANASHAGIRLLPAAGTPPCLLLEISDDGIGFAPARSAARPSWTDEHAATGRAAGRELGSAQHTGSRHHDSGARAGARRAPGPARAGTGPEMSPSDADNRGQRPVRVFVVDDHAVVRRGLHAYLEMVDDMEVVGEAADGQAALDGIAALVAADRPVDVVLMDLIMPGMDGVTATAAITQRHPELKVVAMTSFTEADKVHGALEAGAAGYLLKDAEADVVAAAIRAARRGEVHLDPVIARQLTRSLVVPEAADRGHADRTGARGPCPGGSRPFQPADRRCAGDQRAHRSIACEQHPHQAGVGISDAGRLVGDPRGNRASSPGTLTSGVPPMGHTSLRRWVT